MNKDPQAELLEGIARQHFMNVALLWIVNEKGSIEIPYTALNQLENQLAGISITNGDTSAVLTVVTNEEEKAYQESLEHSKN